MALLLTWILYAFVGGAVFSLIFFWAVRNRQFRDQDRARHLPLNLPDQEVAEPEGEGEN